MPLGNALMRSSLRSTRKQLVPVFSRDLLGPRLERWGASSCPRSSSRRRRRRPSRSRRRSARLEYPFFKVHCRVISRKQYCCTLFTPRRVSEEYFALNLLLKKPLPHCPLVASSPVTPSSEGPELQAQARGHPHHVQERGQRAEDVRGATNANAYE